MKTIKNVHGKTVCRVDELTQEVEIIRRGCRTLVRFHGDGTMTVTNTTIDVEAPNQK